MVETATDARDERRGSPSPNRRGPRWVGRRAAQGLYYALVVSIAVAATYQLTQQIFFAHPAAQPASYASCDEGLRDLYAAIGRARRAAQGEGTDVEAASDEAALLRYRAALAPSWQHRDAVAEMCRGRGRDALLDVIERLRYSEEHDVRHQAAELSTLRRRVHGMVARDLNLRGGDGSAAEPDDDP